MEESNILDCVVYGMYYALPTIILIIGYILTKATKRKERKEEKIRKVSRIGKALKRGRYVFWFLIISFFVYNLLRIGGWGKWLLTFIISAIVLGAVKFIIFFVKTVLEYLLKISTGVEEKKLSDILTIVTADLLSAIPAIMFINVSYKWLHYIMLISIIADYILSTRAMVSVLKKPSKVAGEINNSENRDADIKKFIRAVLMIVFLVVISLYFMSVCAFNINPQTSFSGLGKRRTIIIWQLLYYTIISFTTIGFGDIHPTSLLSQIVAILLSFTSVLCLILFAGNIMSFVQNSGESTNTKVE